MTAPTAEERVILLQLKPRQAALVNMMWALSAAILCGEGTSAERITLSVGNYMRRYRADAPEEVQEITRKISNIRNAFTDEQLRQLNITNYKVDLATGDWSKEKP